MRRWLAIATAKLISFVSRVGTLGAGGTWPGEIALTLDSSILLSLSKELSQGFVLVAGTNGKTTTAKMIETIISEFRIQNSEFRIVHNATGANLVNGITSALIQKTDFLGKLKADMGIFEVDEVTLPLILRHVSPKIVVLLNLFRDQLDRYGEVDLIAEKWFKALSKLPKTISVVVNADDPHLAYIGKQLKAKVKYFGLGNKNLYLEKIPHAMDCIYCPNCGKKLDFAGIYLSHLGQWRCDNCKLSHPRNDIKAVDVKSPLEGVYSLYNTMAAILTAEELGVGSREQIGRFLKDFKPVFGRQEQIEVAGKKIALYLAKNPAGFNACLQTVLKFSPKVLILVLNDRIPDGRDVSWIWDVDFEVIPDDVSLVVSGDRVYDLALRIKYSRKVKYQISNIKNNLIVESNLQKAIQIGLGRIKEGEILYILPTYSAMLEVRKILKGRKIL